MKKLLLGVMMFVCVPAYADQHITLPDTVIGEWCPTEIGIDDNIGTVYERVLNPPCSDALLYIQQDGYSELLEDCIYDKIEQENTNAFLVHTHCEEKAEGDHTSVIKVYTQNLEYKIIDGRLVVIVVPET